MTILRYTCTTRERMHDRKPGSAVQLFPGRASVPTAPVTGRHR